MILFQVRDLAAKACGEPHIAPTWEIAKASLGAMLAKTPELAERAHAIRVDYICDWDPENGLCGRAVISPYLDSESGDVCLAEFRAACAKEENEVQELADRPLRDLNDDEMQAVFEKQCEVSNILDAAERRKR